ncbi:amidohydrolase family protein [Microbulbifer rhizosphaerae]|uniref:L-fuconolactonase n=1 Tax=Microbulbifer rhizosphaerae TaxID=1562603 RepID=A0A7W4WBU6_9GAMM|nr:amidohydrolase family protein [Microbulbifer rhizosphaerae]MBB3061209.1 L-fuconolactonase [Microbulbifer rhizosphaerae]
MLRIDAHQHFWQLSRGDYEWLGPELEVLYRDYLPAQLQPLLAAAGVSKTVLVQAAESVEETEFMLRLADDSDFIAGVVGWVDMESGNAVDTLDRLARHSAFKGIRPMIQDIADTRWMLKPELEPVFTALIERGLTFDALVTPRHLEPLLILLRRYPDLKAVIDHGAKPEIATGRTTEWAGDIARIASETSACCKLSGLMTEAGDNPGFESLMPYMEHLLACFGAHRLMWGSDWPVLELAGNYPQWLAFAERFVAPLTEVQQQAIWAGNAERFYHLQV